MNGILKTASLIITGITFLTTVSIANSNDDVLNFGNVMAGDTVTKQIINENCTELRFHENIEDFYSCNQDGANVNITFAPIDTTYNYTGILYRYIDGATHTKDGENDKILLTGVGTTDTAIPTRLLDFEPQGRGLDFNSTNTTRQLIIYNRGNSTLTVNAIRFHARIDNVFSYNNDGWDMTIGANSSKTISIVLDNNVSERTSGLVYIESDKTNTRERSRLLVAQP